MNAFSPIAFAPELDPHAFLADVAAAEARQRSLQRTLQALFRENLLPREHLIAEGAVSWLPLWSQQAVLRFEGLQVGRIGNCHLAGPVAYYKVGQRPQPLLTSAALLSCIAAALPGAVGPGDLQRLIHELDNSVENEALCLGYRSAWAQELVAMVGQGRHTHFIAALRDSGMDNPALLLEQWGTIGHPWHPTYKTKLGLSAQDVVAMSPEFQARLALPLAAIRAGKAHAAMAADDCAYGPWFAATFPNEYARWESALAAQGKDPRAWLPLPLHPFQAQRVIPHKFAAEIANGDLVLLPQVELAASPTMSFRTVVPEGSASLPHIKLPVSLRLTSVQRTVSPKSAVMGPRITRLLGSIVARERGFGGVLDFVGEHVGVHYLDPDGDDDRARHLSVLFRANPMSKRSATRFPVPVGALFAGSPLNGRPLATELVALSFGDHAHGAARFFERYAATVLTAALGAYLAYGVAFEAHQQNSYIMLDPGYAPVQLLVRDFGDLRVHAPTLRETGLDLVAFRPGHSMFESNDPVRDKLLHALMLCHLGELALLLARAYNQPESVFWTILGAETANAFERLRARVNPQRWDSERHALLVADWPAKSFLRMRLSDSSDDLHGHMPNPLRLAEA
jgi:siderophore synthetase component